MGDERDGSKKESNSDRKQKMKKDMLFARKIAMTAQEISPPGRAKTKRNARLAWGGNRRMLIRIKSGKFESG